MDYRLEPPEPPENRDDAPPDDEPLEPDEYSDEAADASEDRWLAGRLAPYGG